MNSRIFDTAELRAVETVSAHEEGARKYRESLGEAALKGMLTVVQYSDVVTDKGYPTLSSSHEVLENQVTIPLDFSPSGEHGRNHTIYFLKPGEAVPVLNKKNKAILIVNRDGSAEQSSMTPRKIKKLKRQGIDMRQRPEPRPLTTKQLQSTTPSM